MSTERNIPLTKSIEPKKISFILSIIQKDFPFVYNVKIDQFSDYGSIARMTIDINTDDFENWRDDIPEDEFKKQYGSGHNTITIIGFKIKNLLSIFGYSAKFAPVKVGFQNKYSYVVLGHDEFELD